MTTHAHFAARLRITALALGCATTKDLCARFQAANPHTQCDLDRLHKWMQGRALPRSAQVYEDWAKLLGTTHTGAWLATCAMDSFFAEVSALTGIAVADLRERETLRPQRASPSPRAGILGGDAALVGAFACYSAAWSPYYRGKLLRSSLRIEPGPGATLQAIYSETLMGRLISMPGEIMITGRTMHLFVRDPGSHLPIFFSLILPGAPISVLCGVMSGACLLAPEGLPSACRVVAIRVPDQAELEASNRYLEVNPPLISADLAAHGVPSGGPALAALVIGFLGEGWDQVTSDHRADFAALLDHAQLSPFAPPP